MNILKIYSLFYRSLPTEDIFFYNKDVERRDTMQKFRNNFLILE